MKLFSSRLALSSLVMSMVCCCLSIAAAGEIKQTKKSVEGAAAAGQKLNKQPVVGPAVEPSIIVATIGDYTITREELEKRLMGELYPYDYYNTGEKAEPINAETVLLKIIAEKAMVIEARKQGYLENETVHAPVKRFMERRLVNLLLQRHIEGKIIVTGEEIKQKLQAEPKLNPSQARAVLERAKANSILNQYYSQIYKKSNVKKLSENFPRAVQIHQRLLYRPKQPRDMGFIRTAQVKDELTQEEKDIVLAEYDSGKVTLKDWFDTLCEIAPPSRPRNLNDPKSVEEFLERALRMPLLVSEAKSLGLDKDEDILKQVIEYEDGMLLSEAKIAKHKEAVEPTSEQIIAYFSKNKEAFGESDNLKIDLIWCQDLETAKKARAELDGGEDFELVRQKYSLEKKGKPFDTHPNSEGLFWKDLWAGEPNEIVGPIKGFYREGIKWRIVKILEKIPGKVKEYSSEMEGQIKSRMMSEQNNELVDKYGKELLKKYPYQIFADRIKDVDPLDIP